MVCKVGVVLGRCMRDDVKLWRVGCANLTSFTNVCLFFHVAGDAACDAHAFWENSTFSYINKYRFA